MAARSGVHIFESRLEATQGMGRRLILHIREITRSRICRIALAGGEEYEFFYKYLANSRPADILWSRLEVFFSEEYCDTSDNLLSVYQLAVDSMLDSVDIDADRIHKMGGGANVESAGAAYASHIGSRPFDIVLLNMGREYPAQDGDVANLAPGPLQIQVAKDGRRLWHLSPAVINEASLVLILAAGEGSSGRLVELLRRNGSAEPEHWLNPTTGELHWFMDKQAASRLLPRT